MKKIYLNLKRFDILKDEGGVNNIAPAKEWASTIMNGLASRIDEFEFIDFTVFMPCGHLLDACSVDSKINIGAQGVYRGDVESGGNFGAFTTFNTAKSVKAMGANSVLIGHCEERRNLKQIIEMGGGSDFNAIDRILNEEIKCALNANLNVLYCVGEDIDQMDNKENVLKSQIETGLKDVDTSMISIAYEPVWAIGPGRPVPNYEYIKEVADYIKSLVNVDVVYGGGLKLENAQMIKSVDSLDGGLIALTKFGEDFGFSVDDFFKIVNEYNKA